MFLYWKKRPRAALPNFRRQIAPAYKKCLIINYDTNTALTINTSYYLLSLLAYSFFMNPISNKQSANHKLYKLINVLKKKPYLIIDVMFPSFLPSYV